MIEQATISSEPFDCPWCDKTHRGCPSCGAETGCTQDHRPGEYAEVLAHCDCDSQEVDGVEFLTISDVEARFGEDEDDD